MAGKVKGSGHVKDKLSAAFVASVTSPGRYLDGAGLFLQVDATGGKRWLQRLMVNGRRHDLGIGPADLVTLAEARKLARANKEMARRGIDPITDREKAKGTPTFDEAAAQVIDLKAKELSNPKHLMQWRNTTASYASPAFGNRKVSDLDRQDVLRALKPIWESKTETATRLRGRIETILDWAEVSGYRSGPNPARWAGNLEHLLPSPSKVAKKEHHPAVPVDEMPRWWDHLVRVRGMAPQALKMVTLTWCRSKEVRGMTWGEVDLTAGMWVIPADRMKAKREHRVPLVPDAVALLKKIPRTSSPFVFHAVRGGALSDMALSMSMRRLHEVAEADKSPGGYFDAQSGRPAVPHGLRSTARSWAAERGYDYDMAELQLAHDVGSKVERAYQRGDMIERRRAMLADWAAFIHERPMDGIVPIRSAR
ncbi:MAG: tyrosine-type recombinase/integrase [Tabrizicola sp.]|uniref:tyrosine-type recombinase/integrase n=1 Tax=Tabrizicola sp. TaxID=2005166 RepID=UPI0027361110|nr:site-specific integrase [Tabrizicola sp.]MDP3264219.1 tyrosine-type recombinase/integrase [Tabrizicola sp.]MDZ4067407.1 tyrosine-type recombinase/integrase [Tabrizicola sp.]